MIYSKNVRIIGGEGQESTAAILSRTQTGLDSLPTIYQSPLIFVFEIDPQRLALSDFPLLSYQIISFLMSLLSALKTLFKSRLSGVGIASYWYSYVVDSKSYVVLVLLIVLANSSSPAAFDPPKERNKTSTREEMTSLLQSILNIVSLPKNKAFFYCSSTE